MQKIILDGEMSAHFVGDIDDAQAVCGKALEGPRSTAAFEDHVCRLCRSMVPVGRAEREEYARWQLAQLEAQRDEILHNPAAHTAVIMQAIAHRSTCSGAPCATCYDLPDIEVEIDILRKNLTTWSR